jgi:hypothetical protein
MWKIKYSLKHAKERALERFGLDLSEYEMFTMVDMIMTNHPDVKLIGRQSNYRTVWKIRWEGCNLFAVYNSKQKVIATFLTKSMVAKRRLK